MSGQRVMLELSRKEVGDLRDQVERQRKLLDRALSIINEAILHGMPVTKEVAAVSNAIRGTEGSKPSAKPKLTMGDVEQEVETISISVKSPPQEKHAYAFVDKNGIDLETISETQAGVRQKYLEAVLGWRFAHPDRYDQDENWGHALKYGQIMPVQVSVINQSPPQERT